MDALQLLESIEEIKKPLKKCHTSTHCFFSEMADAAVDKYFTHDGPNPGVSYPQKVVYCPGL